MQKIRAKGRRAIVVSADVSKEEEVVEMVERTVVELGGLDVVRVIHATFQLALY